MRSSFTKPIGRKTLFTLISCFASIGIQAQSISPACERLATLVDTCYPEIDSVLQTAAPDQAVGYKTWLDGTSESYRNGLTKYFDQEIIDKFMPSKFKSAHEYFGSVPDISASMAVAQIKARNLPVEEGLYKKFRTKMIDGLATSCVDMRVPTVSAIMQMMAAAKMSTNAPTPKCTKLIKSL